MFDIPSLIHAGGLLLIALIIFAESGMFVGFFFPGDTLLISAGVFAAQGKGLDLITLLPVLSVAAILGDNIGYIVGDRYGRQLFKNPHSVMFNPKHLHRAEAFFDKYGTKAMLLAHFVPVVRTFAPAAAGIAEMNRKQFIIFDAIGDTAWVITMTLIGYFVGTRIPNIDHYILLAVVFVMIATLGPALYHFAKAYREKRSAERTPPKVK